MKYTKKILLVLILFSVTYSILHSAWIDNHPTSVTQPDGEVLKCFISGDEFYRRYHDDNNFTIIENPETGWYVYATNVGKELVPTDLIFGKDDPQTAGLKPRAMIDPDLIIQKTQEYWSYTVKPENKKKEKVQVNNTGTIQNIVIYIRFSGESEFTDDTSAYHTMFNALTGNSMYAYYREVSYNTLSIFSSFYPRPSSNIVKSYQDNQVRNYFRPYSVSNPDGYSGSTERRLREHGLLQRAVEAVKSEIPAGLNIDNDNDGYVDNVCFIVSGANDGWSDLLWPHMWALYSNNVTINGKRVWEYNFQLQDFLKSYGNGVLAHEMFHTLGAPDLYHYNQDPFNPVHRWDLMANTTNPPQHMGAWMKYVYGGWISSIPEITSNGTYSLNPVTSSSNNCFMMRSPNSSTQWFLFEYRKTNSTFESAIPGSGLLVYRIIPDSIPNGNRNGPPDEVYIYRPGGTTSADGAPLNAFFSSNASRVELNDETNPSSFLANGSAGGLQLHSVGTAGTTISFSIGPLLYPPTLIYPQNNAGKIELNPVLRWSKVPAASSYEVEVATNSSFANKVFTQSNITDTSVTVNPALNNGTTYYWRVRSVGSGTSNWSSTGIFTTLLGSPTLVEPLNNEFGVLLRDTLKWQAVSGANTYSVEIATNISFSSIIYQQTGISTLNLIIPDGVLENNSLYYWRVKAFKTSPATESEWSEIRYFTSTLAPPILLAPKNDSLGVGINGSFSWQTVSGATSYKLQFSKSSTFATFILNQSGITETTLAFTDLEYNTVYYWRVAGANTNQTGTWSQTYSFKTTLKAPTLVSPNTGVTKLILNTDLIWNKVTGANLYHLQIATDTNMTQIVLNVNNIPGDSIYTCSGLLSKTKYFWRVRAISSDNRISEWSAIRVFTTMLSTPTIPTPADSATGVSVNGTLVWDGIVGATSYHIQVSKSNNFTNLLVNDSTLSGTSLVYSNFDPAVTYYWKVKAKSPETDGMWSDTWSFSTGVGKVQLSSPANGSRGAQVDGKLIWLSMTGAVSYDVQLSAESDFSTKIIDVQGITSLSYDYKSLDGNKLYYWKARAVTASGTGDWSLTWSFTTTAGEPGLLSPINNQGGMRLSDTLRWASAPGAINYTIVIAKNQNMTDVVEQKNGLTNTFHVYSGYKYYTEYYWKVKSSNNDGESPWSETRKFFTMINKPALDEPANDIKNASVEGTLSWDAVAGAEGYSLIVSTNNNLSSPVIEENNINDNQYLYNGFENNKTYYWRVTAKNSDRNSEPSETWKFKTIIGCPVPASPPHDQMHVNYTGQLTWNLVDGADSYKVQLSENSEFKNPLIETGDLIFTYHNFNNLKELTTYYWRVAAYNDYGKCEWSETWKFTTKDPTSVEDKDLKSLTLTAQPNPFNTDITFTINSQMFYNGNIEIYNSLGKMVEVIENININPGINSIYWDPVNLESGIYNVVYKSSAGTATLKVVFIK